MTIAEYAIDAVCAGAEGCIEDDLNESGDIADADHPAAIALAYQIIRAIRANPSAVLALATQHATTEETRTDAR